MEVFNRVEQQRPPAAAQAAPATAGATPIHPKLDRPFRAIVFDWDGTAVVNRLEDASTVAALLTELLRLGVWTVIVTGTNFGHVSRQFAQLVPPDARGRLIACTNRGSEVWGFEPEGEAVYRWVRRATPEEDRQLDAIAEGVRDAIMRRTGLPIEIVYDRLNRRKIDLIPEPEWANPPKDRIGELLNAVEHRLRSGGLEGGLAEAIALTRSIAADLGMPDARMTSDGKYIEVGLTDKGDSMIWLREHLFEPEAIPLEDVLVCGDEFGRIRGFPGSDDRLRQEAPGGVIVSVGPEPNGVPEGVLHLGGGPPRFRDLLADQVKLHRERHIVEPLPATIPRDGRERVPRPSWEECEEACRLESEGYSPALEREIEGRFALANGLIGIRASLPEPTPDSRPLTLIAGLFDEVPGGAMVPHLVPAPNWFNAELRVDGQPITPDGPQTVSLSRRLDMSRAFLTIDWKLRTPGGTTVRQRSLRFVSQAQRPIAVQVLELEAEGGPALLTLDACLPVPEPGLIVERSEPGVMTLRTHNGRHRLAVAAEVLLQVGARILPAQLHGDFHWRWEWTAQPGERATLVRIVAMVRGDEGCDPTESARLLKGRAVDAGPKQLLNAHLRAWHDRWVAGAISIDGSEWADRAVRFAQYHLTSAANPEDDRVSIGARSLTGMGYLGHIFWDTEIFCLPFFIFTWPEAARAMLMYRYHTLPAACAKAAAMGYRGALYAWESADTGEETTPDEVTMPDGTVIPIFCGRLEHHISADVAYAVWQYWQATGDWDFLCTAGAPILIETARFWASRASLEADGYYHIRNVIGPDEYHEGVDDNAYTNLMARWNIECALEVARVIAERDPDRWDMLSIQHDLTAVEQVHWADVAQRLWVNRDPGTGVLEEFEGFFKKDYYDLSDYAGRQAPLDVILGREVVKRSQIVKQADVVMLLALLEDAFSPEEREANFRYYLPRTAHGSSLSPAIHALVAARQGDTQTAEAYFRQAALIDLNESMGTTADGIHIATQGGIWQAAVFGFAGMRMEADGLSFDPHLPETWRALRFNVQWRGRRLQVEVRNEQPHFSVQLVSGEPMAVYFGRERHQIAAGETRSA